MRQTNDTTNTNAESNTTTSSSFDDDHPIASIQGPFRLGYGYMILLFFLSLVSPTSLVYYAAVEAEDATRYFAYGQIFFPICVACNLILFIAHPREKSWQNKFTALYLVSYFTVYDVASFVGQVFTNPIISDLNTENGVGLASAFPFTLVFAHVPICYLLIRIRRRIAKFNDEKLHHYLDETVFLQGFLSLPPLIFLSVEAIQCTVDVTEEEIVEEKGEGRDGIYYKCGALLYPQYSNCFLLSVFLGVRLFIAPLTNVRPSIRALRIFNCLPRKVKFQLSCVAFIVVSNVTLYSMSSEGPSTVFILSLFGVSCLGIVSLAISEGVAIVKDVRKNSEAVRGKGQGLLDTVLEHVFNPHELHHDPVKGTNIHVHINENKTQDE